MCKIYSNFSSPLIQHFGSNNSVFWIHESENVTMERMNFSRLRILLVNNFFVELKGKIKMWRKLFRRYFVGISSLRNRMEKNMKSGVSYAYSPCRDLFSDSSTWRTRPATLRSALCCSSWARSRRFATCTASAFWRCVPRVSKARFQEYLYVCVENRGKRPRRREWERARERDRKVVCGGTWRQGFSEQLLVNNKLSENFSTPTLRKLTIF